MYRSIQKLFSPVKATKTSFRPTLEGLEERTLMAGDVMVQMVGNDLHITGDAHDNSIELRPFSGSYYNILGKDGTTVDGSSLKIVNASNVNNVIIDMGHGNDDLVVRWIETAYDLNINMGRGQDEFTIRDGVTIGDDLIIDFGADPAGSPLESGRIMDTHVGSAINNNDLLIKGNEGNQYVYLYQVTVEDDLDVELTDDDNEQDEVILNSVHVQGESGDGRFEVFAKTVTGSNVTNNVNDAGDVQLRHVGNVDLDGIRVSDDVWVHGRNSWWLSDTINIGVEEAGDIVRVRGYAGADTITYTGNLDVELYGGSGDDTLTGGNGNDRIFGESGKDTLQGSGGHDRLDGGTENDTLRGGTGNDALLGWQGTDDLDGNHGYDRYLVTPDQDVSTSDMITMGGWDVKINFHDGVKESKTLNGQAVIAWAGQWTADEIWRVDDALACR